MGSSQLLSRLAFFGTVFNVYPIPRPFLTPLKLTPAPCTGFGREAILDSSHHFCSTTHGQFDTSQIRIAEQHDQKYVTGMFKTSSHLWPLVELPIWSG